MPLSNIIRDRASRILVAESEVSRKALKYIIHNQENPLPIRIKAQIELHKMGRHTSYVGVRDRCILSGKGKGIVAPLKLSRVMFREMALGGLLPGIRKSHW